MGRLYAQFGRHGHVGKAEHAARKAQRAYPEGDGQHEHEAHDVDGMEAPRTVKAVAHRCPAKERAKVVAHRTAREGNEAHAGKREPAVYGADGQTVVADEDDIIQDDEQDGIQKLHAAYLLDAADDFFKAVALDLVIQKPAGHEADEEYEKLTKERKEFFHRPAIRNESDVRAGAYLSLPLCYNSFIIALWQAALPQKACLLPGAGKMPP